ncbi:unnamed protein product [Oikopleura dioica]|uniref:Protein kinase domain-containing protein n=1 Tax=Oikopleura dioica TaxID=34765 RepID=E4XV30_OIKDI|nr:unnamed protein product [Oikopleura dioica]
MVSDFSQRLTALKLDKEDREYLRDEINNWAVKIFLPKLKRETDKTEKCRLIASVERHTFEDDIYAIQWKNFQFVENHAESEKFILVDEKRTKISGKMNASFLQKKILGNDSDLLNTFISKNDVKNEGVTKGWKPNEYLEKIFIGGEAAIFKEKFENHEMAVRVHAFDPFIFTEKLVAGQLKTKTHLFSDYTKATYGEQNENVVPFHENVVRHYANIELYHHDDKKKEDCIGWITIMEKCDNDNLHNALKNDNLVLDDRKRIANGIISSLEYLQSIGITHCDKKPQNFLLLRNNTTNNIIPKLCDYGLITESSGRKSYREMGYARRGSKYRIQKAIHAGTPGFFGDSDNYFFYIFCDWISSWSLLYRPINERERKRIEKEIKNCNAQKLKPIQGRNVRTAKRKKLLISEITKVIRLPDNLKLRDKETENLMHTCQMSSINLQINKIKNVDMQNLPKDILDQNDSALCVPISVTELIRHAIKYDLSFDDTNNEYTTEEILTTITMNVYPRSLAGLNRNPNKAEKDYQMTEIVSLLERMAKETFFNVSGWEIVRSKGYLSSPRRSSFDYREGKISKFSARKVRKIYLHLFSSSSHEIQAKAPLDCNGSL